MSELNQGEELLFTIQKAKWIYAPSVFIILISLPYFSIEGMAGLGLAMLTIGAYFFARAYRYEGFLTTKRVVKRTGVFFRNEEEMVSGKIETVGLLNVLVWQNASVKGTGGTPIVFKYIKNGKLLKEIISQRK